MAQRLCDPPAVPCPLWLIRISGVGSQEEQGPAQAAWNINVGADASLPEAGEGQAVSSLMGEFSLNSIPGL